MSATRTIRAVPPEEMARKSGLARKLRMLELEIFRLPAISEEARASLLRAIERVEVIEESAA